MSEQELYMMGEDRAKDEQGMILSIFYNKLLLLNKITNVPIFCYITMLTKVLNIINLFIEVWYKIII